MGRSTPKAPIPAPDRPHAPMHETPLSLRERLLAAVRASRTAGAQEAERRDRFVLPGVPAASLRRSLVIAAVVAAFLSVLAPFGTEQAPVGLRLAYWELVLLAGTVVGASMWAMISERVDPEDRRPYATAVLCAAAETLPITLGVRLASQWLFPTARLASFPSFLGAVFVICLGMSLLNAFALRRETRTSAGPSAPPAPRFVDRLPAKLHGADIQAVKAEDHYLRIFTTKGSDLILMRLSDAVVELDGLEGAQTHRSWWVARAAVQGAVRRDGRAVLQLDGGVEAPVSRNYVRSLRDAGWL